MKKRLIALLVSCLMICLMLTGCDEDSTEIIRSEKEEITTGNYELFTTTDVQKYLNFLENFDETRYEIVDISTSIMGEDTSDGSSEFYMVTYKAIQHEAN